MKKHATFRTLTSAFTTQLMCTMVEAQCLLETKSTMASAPLRRKGKGIRYESE